MNGRKTPTPATPPTIGPPAVERDDSKPPRGVVPGPKSTETPSTDRVPRAEMDAAWSLAADLHVLAHDAISRLLTRHRPGDEEHTIDELGEFFEMRRKSLALAVALDRKGESFIGAQGADDASL